MSEAARDQTDGDIAAQAGGKPRILIIKHGALGDFVQAFGPFQAIRRHHRDAHVTLMTTLPYAGFARASGLFDAIWVDSRPSLFHPREFLALARRLREGGFSRIYDLQTSSRSSWYFHLFNRFARPEWSGIAQGCSHPHANPERNHMHTVERQAEQLLMAGISPVPAPDFSFARSDWKQFGTGPSFCLFVPGGSAHRPTKRWPVERFAKLARLLALDHVRPVLLGGSAEAEVNQHIASTCPEALDLTGQTDLFAIAELARHARAAVGNDTGPMHLIAAIGCPSLVLFSAESDPALCAPRGQTVNILRRKSLADLTVEEVAAALPLKPPPHAPAPAKKKGR
ncbi:MAG: glycosyltransferase family 9 protein [Ferrovibrionaceae bacterium]